MTTTNAGLNTTRVTDASQIRLGCEVLTEKVKMMPQERYNLGDFWMPKLGSLSNRLSGSVPGWQSIRERNQWFVGADSSLRTNTGELSEPVWLVAAPGAVGKSTLAKEIAAATGAIYVDLAVAETVAGNYLTGGLVKTGSFENWKNNRTTVLIDALDEARLRVTQNSFMDFLGDVRDCSSGRSIPTVLFGRTSIIEEAWYIFEEKGISCPILDIQFYDEVGANELVMAELHRIADGRLRRAKLINGSASSEQLSRSLSAHAEAYRGVVASMLKNIDQIKAGDGRRFSGYAPVLQAVAASLAEVTNPTALNEVRQKTMQQQVLQELTTRILDRESTKLREQLPDEFSEEDKITLYSPTEQVDRLVTRILGVSAAGPTVPLRAELYATYDSVVQSFLPQHPFLDATGTKASGAVFEALILANGLLSESAIVAGTAQRTVTNGEWASNPFLIDFYMDLAIRKQQTDPPLVPPEHIVPLYESVHARASSADVVRMSIDGDEEKDEAIVEIVSGLLDDSNPRVTRELLTSQAGKLMFPGRVVGVSITAPQIDVEFGCGGSLEFVGPVYIMSARFHFNCSEIYVSYPLGLSERLSTEKGIIADGGRSVVLESSEEPRVSTAFVPRLRPGAELTVLWPGSERHPWTPFAGSHKADDADRLEPALNRLRRLVMAFRSHSRGRLARYRDKIEHLRMTQGTIGEKVRERLIQDGVLTLEGNMYFLDPDVLGMKVGATYQDMKVRRYNESVRRWIAEILDRNPEENDC